MNRAAHQIASSIIDQPMAGERIFSRKNRCNDVKDVVPATFPGAGMTGVKVRFVLDGDRYRLQDCQPLAQLVDGCRAHQAGNAFLNGLTVTLA